MATKRKFKAAGVPEPDGRVRRSQLLTTYGPGALVDLVHDAVLITGLENWRANDWIFIQEPRLRDQLAPRIEAQGRKLSHDRPFRAPPSGDEKTPTKWNGIEVREFPTWFVCQNPQCRALVRARSLEYKRHRYVHDCIKTGSDCVPVRFVSACKNGHLDEFPWVWFVHQSEPCEHPRLSLFEGPTGDFGTMIVKCRACDRSRKLVDALEETANPHCRGHQPWLGYHAPKVECSHRQRLLVRTASNSYFSQIESALSIPETGPRLYDLVKVHWNILQVATAATLPVFRALPEIQDIANFGDDEVLKTIERVRNNNPPPRLPIRTAEFLEFVKQPAENTGELPRRDELFFARRRSKETPSGLASIVLARKLREVRAQIGFSRIEAATPNLQGAYDDTSTRTATIAQTSDWLPAVEILGEGIFVQLDEARVKEWENRPAVLDRMRELSTSFDAAFAEMDTPPPFPGARFFLLHSLSHLLITALSLECGYAAAAIRERIYCSRGDEETPMAAILLSTGSPGSEGTLGGLVEEGSRFETHLQRAFSLAELCSNDPVCALHDPRDHSDRPFDGAACHGCLYIGEPSCEWFNRFLDRALVVPIIGHENARELAYFPQARLES